MTADIQIKSADGTLAATASSFSAQPNYYEKKFCVQLFDVQPADGACLDCLVDFSVSVRCASRISTYRNCSWAPSPDAKSSKRVLLAESYEETLV